MLAPTTQEVAQILNGSFSSVVSLTSWSQAITNTVLYPLDPLPSWYSGLNTDILTLQSPAQKWLDTTGPQLGSAVAQSFINYGDMFANASSDMIALMTAIEKNVGHTPNAAQLAELNALLKRLLKQAGEEQATGTSLASAMTDFYTSVKAAHGSLSTDIAAAAATLSADETTVAALSSQIASLQQQLAAITQKAQDGMQGATTAGVSLSISVVTYTMTMLVTGAATGVLGIAGGFVALGIDIAESIKENAQILNDMQAIASLQSKLNAEDVQVAALQGIISNLDALETANQTASDLYTGLLPSLWQGIGSELQSIIDELKQPNVDVTFIDGLVQLQQAASRWNTIVTQAGNIQDSSFTVGPTVNLPSDSASA